MPFLTWPLMILTWIVLSPVYIAVGVWMRVTGKRIPFDDHEVGMMAAQQPAKRD